MPAMTSLSLCSTGVTGLSTPCDFLTRSQRFPRGKSSDTMNYSNPSMSTQSSVVADVLASRTELTGRRTSDFSHGGTSKGSVSFHAILAFYDMAGRLMPPQGG
jgi:hypothetical protein